MAARTRQVRAWREWLQALAAANVPGFVEGGICTPDRTLPLLVSG